MARPTRRPARGTTPKPARRPITVDDLRCLVGIADPDLSPDGSRLALTRSQVSRTLRTETSIWIVATDGKSPPRPLTAGPKDRLPRFSPNGTRLAFLRGGDAGVQLAVLDLAGGGEARTLTRFPEGSIRSFRWSPDGRSLAVAFRATEPEWTKAAIDDRRDAGEPDPPRVITTPWHRLDGDGYFGAARHRLHLVDAATGSDECVYALDTLGTFSFGFAPDGSRLALATNRDPDALFRPWADEIAILDLAKGTLEPLAGLPIGPKSAVAWSPDGTRLAWAGRRGRDGSYSTENLELWTGRAKGHAKPRSLTHAFDVCLAAATLSDSAEGGWDATVTWTPDSRSILTRIGREGEGHLVAIDADGGPARFLTDGPVEQTFGNAVAGPKGSTLVATLRTAATEPIEAGLVAVDAKSARGAFRPLTAFNAALRDELDLAEPESHRIPRRDGTGATHAWILRPPPSAPKAAKSGRSGIVQVHGGPHAQYGVAFFHELQLLAAQGHVVAYGNPRGSKGYGRDHCAAIRGRWGTSDWEDVSDTIDFLRGLRGVDADRVGIAGGSYGGYMTNWAIAHRRDLRAAITDRCVSNLLSFAGNSDYPIFPGEYWSGTTWESPEALWESSPIRLFKGVRTPTLVIHSEGDLRCNVEQAEQVHAALCLQGVPTRFVRYPRSTSHGMSRGGPPGLRMHRLREIVAWWERWLR
jgi:dipeptidyl aminopeptidase/acylaminoacyl peptidase